MAFILPAILCLASGFLLVSLGWTGGLRLASEFPFKVSLSVPYGLALFSVAFFFARILGITNLIAIDLVVFALLLASLLLMRRHATAAGSVPTSHHGKEHPAWFERILTAAFTVTLCAALYSAVLRTLAHPHGNGWDAFAIWNLHARFLFRGGAGWRDGFSALIPWSHPDYPLLLPAAIAHFWSFLGHDASGVPAVIALLFTFSTVGLLCSALSMLRSRALGMLGGMALLSTPAFIDLGTWQYADVPLSFFFLATTVFLCSYDEFVPAGHARRLPGLLALAGISAGFGAWTKNEGVLFLCAIVLAVAWSMGRERRHGISANNSIVGRTSIAPLLIAVALILPLIVYFKRFVAPPGDLFTDPATMLHKMLDPARYWAVIWWYVLDFFRFGRWMFVPGTLLLVGFYFAAGRERQARRGPGFRAAVVALAFTLAGYFAVYLITPLDIYWHLRFSLDRLFLQVWPAAIFLFFLSVRFGSNQIDPLPPGC
jgi:Dolichyl-phosphate-mannose-protein mannosyltransferase